MKKQRSGAITLLAVFLTATVAFLILLGENIHSIEEKQRAHAEVISEQAFYAAQSCLDEALLRLRGTAVIAGPVTMTVGQATCTATITPDVLTTSGTISSMGTNGSSIRSIASKYHDAGATVVHQENDIVHVIDRSGSMDDASCSIASATTQGACTTAGGLWLTKLVQAKTAATNFTTLDLAAPSIDKMGVVSFSTHATINQTLTSSAATINNAIGGLTTDATTNIGEAITTASGILQPATGIKKFMILLTDGIPNEPFGDCTAHHQQSCDFAKEQAAIAKASPNNNVIIVIGLGSSTQINEPLLQTIASTKLDGSAWYYHAPNAAGLQAIYTEIASDISHYNIGQGSWNEQ